MNFFKLAIVFILGLFPIFSFGQFSIEGKVRFTGDGIFQYNVLILKKDSTFLKGDGFMTQSFSIDQIHEKEILVKISSENHIDKIISVEYKPDEHRINLGEILLAKESVISEVVIQAKKAIFEKKDGNTIVNVENTMLGSSTSVLELLSKTPSVKIEDNSVAIFGKGEALIYLNDKQITYERLGAIPVNRITKVEIITNPSAKYDARGRAVINIITKVNTQEGFNGQLTENATMAKHFLNSTALNLNYRKGRVSLFSDYSFTSGTDWKVVKSDRIIAAPNETFVTHNDNHENSKLTHISNYRLGAEFTINDHSDLSVQYDGLYNRYDLDILSETNSLGSNSGKMYLNAFNNGQNINTNNSLNINYNNKLDSLGSSIFIGGQYSNFNSKLFDQIDETIVSNENEANRANRINDGKSIIQLLTVQADYLKIFKNESKLELGAKYSYTNNDGRVDFRSKAYGSDTWVNNPLFSNNFLYIENIPALYLQFYKQFSSKLNASVGVRSEFSKIYGFSRAYNTKAIDTEYLNIFPSAKLTYIASDNVSYIFSFSSRINRPDYKNIDPFVWYNDSLSSIQGNPNLIPEKNYNLDFQWLFKKYSLKASYTRKIDPMQWMPIIGNNGPNSIIQSVFNLKSSDQYYLSLDVPFEYKFWSSFNTVSGTYERVNADIPNTIKQSSRPQFYFYSYNQLNILNYFRLDISGEYTSGYSDGMYNVRPNYSFAAGASKSFLNKKLIVRIIGNDIFRTAIIDRSSQIGNIYTNTNKQLNTFFIRATIIYKFGKLKEPKYNNKSINTETFNRISQ